MVGLEKSHKSITTIPTIDYFERTYGKSLEGNDQKAVQLFKTYEPKEKLRRLQNELLWIKSEKVSESTLENVIGKKRQVKHESFRHWAELMLLWIVSAKS